MSEHGVLPVLEDLKKKVFVFLTCLTCSLLSLCINNYSLHWFWIAFTMATITSKYRIILYRKQVNRKNDPWVPGGSFVELFMSLSFV